MCAAQQIFGGHPLEQNSGGSLVTDVLRNSYEPICGHVPILHVSTRRQTNVADPIARNNPSHPFTDIYNLTDGLYPRGKRWSKLRIASGAYVDVDEVHAHGGLSQSDFARRWRWHLHFAPIQNVTAAVPVDHHSVTADLASNRPNSGSGRYPRNLKGGGRRWASLGQQAADRGEPGLIDVQFQNVRSPSVTRLSEIVAT